MKTVKFIILTIALVVLVSSSLIAETDPWSGLTISTGPSSTTNTYNANIPEYYTGPGYYSGTIAQYASLNTVTGIGYNKIGGGGTVYFTLPQININNASPFYGVCIDTNEYTGSPVQLRKGWEADGDPLVVGNNVSRFNGTVLNEDAWKHTTYLFNQHAANLPTWWGNNKESCAAFQLAIWEVMSGDGLGGANWGSGYFTATGLNTNLLTLANGFVNEAYNSGFATWNSSNSADSALYFHDHQDFLVYAPTTIVPGDVPSVPEIPASMLAPLGLAAFGLIRRRFAK